MAGYRPLIIIAALLVLIFSYFIIERLIVDRRLRRLKLRIAVSGTRGKSSVTRLIAGALRESGLRVLAKTTGSAAMTILPDGSEREIARPGPASILENKALLGLARRHRAEALVCEMMSISPECLWIETHRLLKPQTLLITNVRLDHRDEQGRTREEIARSLAAAIRPGCTVFVPEPDHFSIFDEQAQAVKARIIRVPDASGSPVERDSPLGRAEFEENIRLALAATDSLGIPRPVALRGMSKAKPDRGRLEVVKASLGVPAATWMLVSAFAANEPESTRRTLDKLRGLFPFSGAALRGVLNLREDRGERTLQWLDALKDGFFREFDTVALVGSAAVPALRRKVKAYRDQPGVPARLLILSDGSPERITAVVSSAPTPGAMSGRGLIIGLGDMGGLGLRLKEYWERIGERTEKGVD